MGRGLKYIIATIVYGAEGLRYELAAPLTSIGWSLAPQGA